MEQSYVCSCDLNVNVFQSLERARGSLVTVFVFDHPGHAPGYESEFPFPSHFFYSLVQMTMLLSCCLCYVVGDEDPLILDSQVPGLRSLLQYGLPIPIPQKFDVDRTRALLSLVTVPLRCEGLHHRCSVGS